MRRTCDGRPREKKITLCKQSAICLVHSANQKLFVIQCLSRGDTDGFPNFLSRHRREKYLRFQNGRNKEVVELRVVKFWSEIIKI